MGEDQMEKSTWGGRSMNTSSSSPVTHHHHSLVLGNLSQVLCRYFLGLLRPLGGQSRGGQKLPHGGCLDTEVHVLWK